MGHEIGRGCGTGEMLIMVIGRGRGVAGCYWPYWARVWHGWGIFQFYCPDI